MSKKFQPTFVLAKQNSDTIFFGKKNSEIIFLGTKKFQHNFLGKFWPRRLACAMCAPCVAWPLLLPAFSLSFFLFKTFEAKYDHTRVKTCWAEQGHTRDQLLNFPLRLSSFLLSFFPSCMFLSQFQSRRMAV